MATETSNARGEAEYEYEVWQGDALQAGGSTTDYASAQSEAGHYAMMYAPDGPVEVRIYEKRLLTAPPPAAARRDVRWLVAKLAAHVRPTCSELWDEAQAFLAAEGVQAEPNAEARGVVDEAMLERALIADAREYGASIPESRARRLLTAALTGERNG